MARIFLEDFDARDNVAEDIFVTLIRRGGELYVMDRLAKCAYDAADAFLKEREKRMREEADEDGDDFID